MSLLTAAVVVAVAVTVVGSVKHTLAYISYNVTFYTTVCVCPRTLPTNNPISAISIGIQHSTAHTPIEWQYFTPLADFTIE